ncbi:MAG: cobyric acid synthase [Chloroflexi bacterium]|nr:cobyric acid synthase [Chloroflexota bacterium]
MVQGTASSVGKSVIATALCRIFRQDGLRVAPFKAQNMALNSFVTRDGGEIGRAQAAQAEAAGVEATVEMNPILLKPETDARSQVIVRGRPLTTSSARHYYDLKPQLWSVVEESFASLAAAYDLIVIEGAGSPAEVNLRESDIVNMRVAKMAQAPVLLVGDVDKGGVFASLVGTLELIEPEERELVRGFVINKFRGDISLLRPGLDFLEAKTGKPVVGVVPYYRDIVVAQEDSVYLDHRREDRTSNALLDVAVVRFPHISNFDDFDPLEQEPAVRVRYVSDAGLLGRPDLVILPGTKSTMADLRFLRHTGLAQGVVDLARSGVPIIGICGGFQMLGKAISDPYGVESAEKWMAGLGLLPNTTVFEPVKTTRQVAARVACDIGLLHGIFGVTLSAYEIHVGATDAGGAPPVFRVSLEHPKGQQHQDGAISEDGLVLGTYLHGLFDGDEFRRRLLAGLLARKGAASEVIGSVFSKEQQYDKLADLVRGSVNMALLRELCELGSD